MTLPLATVHVLEKSNQPAGRLLGLLLADQGAHVTRATKSEDDASVYLDRGKSVGNVKAEEEYDVVIADGVKSFSNWNTPTKQIRVAITAAVPGDKVYGDLPDDVSEDVINGLCGFYTDLGVTKSMLGHKKLYTPLPLCSTYAGVDGAIATLAALIRRAKSGEGSDVTVSRLAAGLSAIGALALETDGLPPHLTPKSLLSLPPALLPHIEKSRQDPAYFEWLKRRLSPFAAVFPCKDGRAVMPVGAVNRRIARVMLETMGIWQMCQEKAGLVDVNPYDPANADKADRNIALPGDLGIQPRMMVAGFIEEAFKKETSEYWENTLSKAGVPCAVVRTFDEWKATPQAKEGALVVDVDGQTLLGRAAWVDSAKPYPKVGTVSTEDGKSKIGSGSSIPANKPLQGIKVVDLANVIAGPACGRMFAELGATVYKIDSANPDHVPVVTISWQMELGQGKTSILLDLHKPEGKAILKDLMKDADVLVANKLDHVLARIGLAKDQLKAVNPNAVGCQVTAWCGEKPNDHDLYPGYDPLLQGVTGITARFGGSVETPELHGVASCVDYITGYLACFGGLVALYAREQRGSGGDWAQTSLEAGAALVQWPFQFAKPPIGDEKCIDSVKILSVQAIKDTHVSSPTSTFAFYKSNRDGVTALNFVPTWFIFNGQVVPNNDAPLPGDGSKIVLEKVNVSNGEDLIKQGIVGRTLWAPA